MICRMWQMEVLNDSSVPNSMEEQIEMRIAICLFTEQININFCSDFLLG